MDGSHLRFLGTGTAFHTDGRGSQSILFRPRPGAPFLVDLGPTAMAAIMRYDVDTRGVDRLFVTHLHGDHTAGWPFLLLHFNFVDRRTKPFEVWGPSGVEVCLQGLMRLCYPDVLQDPKLGFEIRYHELAVEEAAGLDAGDLGFDVLPMDHHPSSLAYRFELGGKKVAVTGDTRWCENLEKLARGSDLLIVECTSVERMNHAHVSLQDLREHADRLGRCDVVLVHLTDEVAADLAADPVPRVTPAHDGLALAL